MSQTKRVTVAIDFDAAGNPTSTKVTRDPGGGGSEPGVILPEMPRRDALGEVYAALASELLRWKGANPGAKESSNSEASAPVVWRLHQVAREVLRGEIDVAAATPKMNAVLAQSTQRLGAEHSLLQSEVARLIVLMTDSANVPLAPYDPYDVGDVRARTW